ncbi:hypothetical protein BELL_0733g00030 [Botrytis elliptica]|uniref:Uncharacterized protein n=1 Tax=Botrytis elliptica TaxID=278938 RepID=A0A4Z1J9A2_9HELO|nr:hypothetical protein BELL_0733g00030 [Botrytis elliptica]
MSDLNDEGNGSGPSPPQDQYAQDVPDRLIDFQNTISPLEIQNAVAKREIKLLKESLHDIWQRMDEKSQEVRQNEYRRGQLDKLIMKLERKVKKKITAIATLESEHSELQIRYQELKSTTELELAHQLDEQAKVNNVAENKIEELKQQYQDLLSNHQSLKELDETKTRNFSHEKGRFQAQAIVNEDLIKTLQSEIKANREEISRLKINHQQLKELDETKTQRFGAEKIRLQAQATVDHDRIETLQSEIKSKDEEIYQLKTTYESLKKLNNTKAKWASDEKSRFQEQANINDNVIKTLQSEFKINREEISRLKIRERSWRKCAEALLARLNEEKALWIKFPGVSAMSHWWNVQNTKDVESDWYKFLVARGIITHE